MVMHSPFRSPRDGEGIPHSPLKHSIDLGTLASVLVQAAKDQRVWLDDFADEQVQVSADLYQIIQAIRLFGRAA